MGRSREGNQTISIVVQENFFKTTDSHKSMVLISVLHKPRSGYSQALKQNVIYLKTLKTHPPD